MSPIVIGLLGGAYTVAGMQFAAAAREEAGGRVSWWLLVLTFVFWPVLVVAALGAAAGRWFVRSLPDEGPHRG